MARSRSPSILEGLSLHESQEESQVVAADEAMVPLLPLRDSASQSAWRSELARVEDAAWREMSSAQRRRLRNQTTTARPPPPTTTTATRTRTTRTTARDHVAILLGGDALLTPEKWVYAQWSADDCRELLSFLEPTKRRYFQSMQKETLFQLIEYALDLRLHGDTLDRVGCIS